MTENHEDETMSNQVAVGAVDWTVTMVILSIAIVIGSVGNSVVVLVYTRRRDDSTASFFITVLAIADLTVCLLMIPFTITMETLSYRTDSNFVCKFYYLLNTSSTLFSSLLISAIALDRYLCICHPLRRILSLRRARALVLSLVGMSLINGSLVALNVEVTPTMVNETINATHVITTEQNVCDEKFYEMNSTDAQNIFFKIIKRVNHFSFVCCILIVIVFYSLIYRVVLKVRKKTKDLQIQGHMAQPMIKRPSSDDVSHIPHEQSGFRESELWQNLRSAAVLFVWRLSTSLYLHPPSSSQTS